MTFRVLIPSVMCAMALAAGSARPALAHGSGALGADHLHWHNDDVAGVVAEAATFGNFGFIRIAGGPAEVVGIEGRTCLRGGLLLFDVRDELVFDVDETIDLEIELELGSSPQRLLVAYDQNGAAGGAVTVDIPALSNDTSNERFQVSQVALERARFAGRGDFGTDIMIVGLPGTTICSVRVEPSFSTEAPSAAGWLEVSVRDEQGAATPARLGLYDSTGRTPLPSNAAVVIEEFDDVRRLALLQLEPGVVSWPSDNPWIFYTDGEYRARVPAGEYQLVAAKGIEYRIENETISVAPGETARVNVELERWADLPAQGWYSGDVHIHLAQRDQRDSQAVLTHAQAEDLHVSNTLRMGNMAATHFPQRAWGKVGRLGADDYTVAPGQEDPRTSVRGHTIHLDLSEPVRDPSRYMLYHEVFERVSELGGVSGYAHVFAPGGVIRSDIGLAIDAPFGLVDFVEVLQSGNLGTDLWFDLLNLGFQIAPAAGSDYPYLGQMGSVRTYVRTGGSYSPDAWFENLAAGRAFVTNGPIVGLTVNGSDIGTRLDLARGDTIRIDAEASINPDIDLLERLVLIEQGEIVAEVESPGGEESLSLEHVSVAENGTWFVVRASGRTRSADPLFGQERTVEAVSAPVYVSVDGQRTWKQPEVAAIANAQITLLEELQNMAVGATSGAEYWQDGAILTSEGPRQIELLGARIDEARALYRELSELAQADRTNNRPKRDGS